MSATLSRNQLKVLIMWDSYYEKAYTDQEQAWEGMADAALITYHFLIPDGPVLDLGAGDGRNALPFAREGRQVEAVDSSSVVVEKMKQINETSKLPLSWINADVSTFEIPEKKYALIIIANILPFLPRESSEALIERAKRGLKNGGLLYVSTFSPEDPTYLENGGFFSESEGHVVKYPDGFSMQFFNRAEILDLMAPLSTVYCAELLSLDLGHGDPHYHGSVDYLGRS